MWWIVFAACQPDDLEKPTLSTTIPTDPTVETPTGTTDPTPDTVTDPTGTTPTETDPVDTAIRFVALGDAGEGNDAQYEVSTAIEQVCADHGGCDFAVYLGDNFYDSGVSGVDD